MNIVLVFNGLGNQMSQYAYYLAKKGKKRNCKYAFFDNPDNAHNGFELGKAFGITYNTLLNHFIIKLYFLAQSKNKIVHFIFQSWVHIFKEAVNYDYSSELMNLDTCGINYYWGGWHSEKNFENIKEMIRKTFVFRTEQMPEKSKYLDTMISKDTGSVSIHIRRGDYLNIPSNSFYQFGGVATAAYYASAISYIKRKIPNPTFYVFSDDIQWCRSFFGNDPFIYVDSNKNINSMYDMYLISKCHHHINANSTFSWWGAWLGEHEDSIVIVPEFFIRDLKTKDLYPNRWIKISSEGILLD